MAKRGGTSLFGGAWIGRQKPVGIWAGMIGGVFSLDSAAGCMGSRFDVKL